MASGAMIVAFHGHIRIFFQSVITVVAWIFVEVDMSLVHLYFFIYFPVHYIARHVNISLL